jgi:tetratricopeptide (TPR) repeat protein
MRTLCLLLALLTTLAVSCVSSHPREELHIKYAQNAAAAHDWPLAARLWGELFLEYGDETPLYGRELGRAQLSMGFARDAVRTLDSTLQLFPDDLETLSLKADAHLSLGESERAALALERRMLHDPEHWETARMLGAVRFEQGLPHAAIGPLRAALKRIRATRQKDPQLSLWVATCAAAEGETGEALDAYKEAFPKVGGVDDLLRAAQLAAGRDGYRTARRDWIERACTLDPQSVAAQLALGELHVSMQRTDLGLAALRRAVEIDPTNSFALLALAELYAELGDEVNTTALVERALVFEEDGEKRAHLEGLAARAKERAAESVED